MLCKVCKSENLQRLDGELTLSQPVLKGLKVPPVYVCLSTLICLDCGFTELVIPTHELRLLRKGESAIGA